MKSFPSAIVGLLILIPCSLLGADDKDKKDSIDGTWIPATAELGGMKLPEDIFKSMKMVIKDSKYTVTVGEMKDQGTLKVDVKAKPMTIDIVGTDGPNAGKTLLAIFELKGDTLKVCYDMSGKARPTAFETKEGTQTLLATYKREKP